MRDGKREMGLSFIIQFSAKICGFICVYLRDKLFYRWWLSGAEAGIGEKGDGCWELGDGCVGVLACWHKILHQKPLTFTLYQLTLYLSQWRKEGLRLKGAKHLLN